MPCCFAGVPVRLSLRTCIFVCSNAHISFSTLLPSCVSSLFATWSWRLTAPSQFPIQNASATREMRVGGVVGGVGFLTIISAAAFWFLWRRKASSAGIWDIQQSQSGRGKTTSEAPGYAMEPYIHSPVLGLGTSDSYYPSNTPSTPHSFPPPPKYHRLSVVDSPSGMKTSKTILLPGPNMPLVKQWVTSLSPTDASHSPNGVVPTEYDYGNDGQSGTFVSPSSPKGVGRKG